MTNWFAGVATLVVGFFAGWVSMRLGRKGPHDRLKLLADIHKELGELDPDKVIQTAIGKELRKLKDLNDAREESWRKFAWTWMLQNRGSLLAIWSLPVLTLTVVSTAMGDAAVQNVPSLIAYPVLVFTAVGIAVDFALMRNISRARREARDAAADASPAAADK